MKTQTRFLTHVIVAGAALAVLGSTGMHFSPLNLVSVAQAAVDESKTEGAEARREMDELVRLNDSAQGRARALEISTRLKISADQFVDFFKAEESAGRRSEATDIAWAKLIKATRVPARADVTQADFQSAQVASDGVSALIHLKTSGAADTVHITASDLADVQSKWTIDQRQNFGKVLKKAADIASSGQVATTEDAFQKALDEMGLRDKYNRGCRK